MFVCAQRDPASEFAQRHRREECTAGYEGVRELYRQYSVNSRMEAVYIRNEMFHTKTDSLKRPLEVVRFLEDEISKGDKKLVRFPTFA